MHITKAIAQQVCIQCESIEQRNEVVKVLEANGVKEWDVPFHWDDGFYVELYSGNEYKAIISPIGSAEPITAKYFLDSNPLPCPTTSNG